MSTTVPPRPWPYPGRGDGSTTIQHISDTHFGAENEDPFSKARGNGSTGPDTIALGQWIDGHVHTGDMIHWYPGGGPATNADKDLEYGWYRDWRDKIKTALGKPFAEAVGNHDLLGINDPNKTFIDEGTDRIGRPSTDWAADVGLAQPNNVYDMGDVRVLTIAPDRWDHNPNGTGGEADYVLSSATLSWLDTQLGATTRPCFIACHLPLSYQYGDWNNGLADYANPTLVSILDSHSNAVGWLSGHRHTDIRNTAKSNHARVFSVGSHNMVGINGPSCCGGSGGVVHQSPTSQYLAENENVTIFLTYYPTTGKVEVRWRDHNSRGWTGPSDGEKVRTLQL